MQTLSPQNLCLGSPFLPPLSVSRVGAGISNFDPATGPGTPLMMIMMMFCAAVKLSQEMLHEDEGRLCCSIQLFNLPGPEHISERTTCRFR